jgi:hypothetical protein
MLFYVAKTGFCIKTGSNPTFAPVFLVFEPS